MSTKNALSPELMAELDALPKAKRDYVIRKASERIAQKAEGERFAAKATAQTPALTPAPIAEANTVVQQTQQINPSPGMKQGRLPIKGWVYVISNKAMPGIVKVGYSMQDPELRARELDHTGAPHRYEVDFEVLVDEPRSIEQRVHRDLSAKREGREWFRCTAEEAIGAIKYVTEGQHHHETFKRADREEANYLAEVRRHEENIRSTEAARVAEERNRANARERGIKDKMSEITMLLHQKLEREVARRFPKIEFLPYWIGWGIAFLIAFYIVFDPIKHDIGAWIAAAIAAAIAAGFHIDNVAEKRKKSAEYLSLIEKRDMAIQEAEQSIRVAWPNTAAISIEPNPFSDKATLTTVAKETTESRPASKSWIAGFALIGVILIGIVAANINGKSERPPVTASITTTIVPNERREDHQVSQATASADRSQDKPENASASDRARNVAAVGEITLPAEPLNPMASPDKFSANWSVETSQEKIRYLRGAQDTMRGRAEAQFYCINGRVVLHSIYEAGSNAATIVTGGLFHSLLINDAEVIPLDKPEEMSNNRGYINAVFTLPPDHVARIYVADSVGHAMQVARGGPTFRGYLGVRIDSSSKPRIQSFLAACIPKPE